MKNIISKIFFSILGVAVLLIALAAGLAVLGAILPAGRAYGDTGGLDMRKLTESIEIKKISSSSVRPVDEIRIKMLESIKMGDFKKSDALDVINRWMIELAQNGNDKDELYIKLMLIREAINSATYSAMVQTGSSTIEMWHP